MEVDTDQLRAQVASLQASLEARDRKLGLQKDELQGYRQQEQDKTRLIADLEAKNTQMRKRMCQLEGVSPPPSPHRHAASPHSPRMHSALALATHQPRDLAKDLSLLAVELARERQAHASLLSQHNDLLRLLAQDDVEIRVMRTHLGAERLFAVGRQVREECAQLYGGYISFREFDGVP